jgi:nucleoside-diphosphate-sugar epimerase
MSKLIFGCGYLGVRVAQRWQEAGESVTVVTRSADRAAEYQQAGYEALVADVTRPETLGDLPSAETVLFAVGFDRAAGDTIHQVYAQGVANVRAALPSSVERFIYISTTGVYGPAGGAWVDESTRPNPQRAGGQASLAAEAQLDDQSIVLRLAGLYGPGRIPYLENLRAGEPIAAPSEGWLNLIHVEDAAAIVLAAEAWANTQPAGLHTFCVSDGQPVVRGDYYREVARRIGAAPPQFVEPDPDSPAAARARSDKRISNQKLQQALHYRFHFPSYREGVAAML